MATIAAFTLPAGSFPLGSIFDNNPGVTVELERIVPTTGSVIPYLWIHNRGENGNQETENLLDDHPEIQHLDTVDDVDGSSLIHVQWDPERGGILAGITQEDFSLLSGIGTATEWCFELRARERESISVFQQYCRDHDLPVELSSLHSRAEMGTRVRHNVTEEQFEALMLAYEAGYYRTPRECTLEDLAKEVGITGQSFGSRLRRGIHRLLGSTLYKQTSR